LRSAYPYHLTLPCACWLLFARHTSSCHSFWATSQSEFLDDQLAHDLAGCGAAFLPVMLRELPIHRRQVTLILDNPLPHSAMLSIETRKPHVPSIASCVPVFVLAASVVSASRFFAFRSNQPASNLVASQFSFAIGYSWSFSGPSPCPGGSSTCYTVESVGLSLSDGATEVNKLQFMPAALAV
jgi:hypothetical protein